MHEKKTLYEKIDCEIVRKSIAMCDSRHNVTRATVFYDSKFLPNRNDMARIIARLLVLRTNSMRIYDTLLTRIARVS